MSTFNRFFDNRLNRLSENRLNRLSKNRLNRLSENRLNRLSEKRFFILFSEIRFRSIDHIKIEKSILTPGRGNPLFHLIDCYVFCFFDMAWN